MEKSLRVWGTGRLGDEIVSKLYEGGIFRLPDERQYHRVMQGNEDYIRERGDFMVLFKETSRCFLGWTVARPLIIDGEVVLAVSSSHPYS